MIGARVFVRQQKTEHNKKIERLIMTMHVQISYFLDQIEKRISLA
jgi:hypothetical protein